MDSKLWTVVIAVSVVVNTVLTIANYNYSHSPKRYDRNLKCVQGELYEEIKPDMFVKSHLECFEQRTF